MPLGNVSSGAAFKAALFFLAIFVVVLATTGWVVSGIMESSLVGELETEVAADSNQLTGIYERDGREALIKSVRQMQESALNSGRILGLFSRSGEPIAGHLSNSPGFTGWGNSTQTLESGDGAYRVLAASRDDLIIVVGQNLELIKVAQRSLLYALLFAGLTVTLLTPTIGYAMSRSVFRRLSVIAQTLQEVSQGNTQIRLPSRQSNDQIGRISRQINLYLEQLSLLTESTRNSITAIAHDLKSPLNRAYLLLQDAEQAGIKGEDVRAPLEKARGELEAVNTIFDTVLRISKLSASNDQTSFAKIRVTELLEDITEIYQPVLENQGQTLLCETGQAANTAIFGDWRMLRQMLVNLVENAAHYCPAGAEILLIAKDCDDNMVNIEVHDNGPGIPSEHHEKVLEPFFRVDVSRKDGGTGLGLALVRAIVIRHGGQIELRSGNPGLQVISRLPVSGKA